MDNRKCEICGAAIAAEEAGSFCSACVEKGASTGSVQESQPENTAAPGTDLTAPRKCERCQSLLKDTDAGPVCGNCQYAASMPDVSICSRCSTPLPPSFQGSICDRCLNAMRTTGGGSLLMKAAKAFGIVALSVVALITGLIGTCALLIASGSSSAGALPFAWLMLGIAGLCIWLGVRMIKSMNDDTTKKIEKK